VTILSNSNFWTGGDQVDDQKPIGGQSVAGQPHPLILLLIPTAYTYSITVAGIQWAVAIP